MTERDKALESAAQLQAWKDVQAHLEAFRAEVRRDAAIEMRNIFTRMMSDRIAALDPTHPAREELFALQREIHWMDLSAKSQP